MGEKFEWQFWSEEWGKYRAWWRYLRGSFCPRSAEYLGSGSGDMWVASLARVMGDICGVGRYLEGDGGMSQLGCVEGISAAVLI